MHVQPQWQSAFRFLGEGRAHSLFLHTRTDTLLKFALIPDDPAIDHSLIRQFYRQIGIDSFLVPEENLGEQDWQEFFGRASSQAVLAELEKMRPKADRPLVKEGATKLPHFVHDREFKPKSAIEEAYYESTIREVLGVAADRFEQAYHRLQPYQRTKPYKTKLLTQTQSPLIMFQATRLFRQPEKYLAWSGARFLLSRIAALQRVFRHPTGFCRQLQGPLGEGSIKEILARIAKEVLGDEGVDQTRDSFVLKDEQVHEKDILEEQVRFLLSLTWKDVSILEGEKGVGVIDYQLKPIEKIGASLRQDAKLLRALWEQELDGWVMMNHGSRAEAPWPSWPAVLPRWPAPAWLVPRSLTRQGESSAALDGLYEVSKFDY